MRYIDVPITAEMLEYARAADMIRAMLAARPKAQQEGE